MSLAQSTRKTRSQAADASLKAADVKISDLKQATTRSQNVRSKGREQPMSISTRSTRKHPTGDNVEQQETSQSENDDAANDGDEQNPESQNTEAVFAPSRRSSPSQSKLRRIRKSREVPWTGLKTGEKIILDDQAEISDLDMHGSVSSDNGDSDAHDNDDESISDESEGPVEEIDIPDDDDDYDGVDNVSDSSDHSDQFEREMEAAWQQDDIDWDDEYVYRYDDTQVGFLDDEQFLNASLGHVDWSIQFIDFDERSRSAQSQVRVDAPMHDSPLVRKVDAMSISRNSESSSSSESSESSHEVVMRDSEQPANSQLDGTGYETDDDLPEESQSPSQSDQAREITLLRPSSVSSYSPSIATPRNKPVLRRIPIDDSRAAVRSVRTPSGGFIQKITLPRSSRTSLITFSTRSNRGRANSSPTSSLSSFGSEFSDHEAHLFNAINGRLFQQAYFGTFSHRPYFGSLQIHARNSFLSGPALHSLDVDAAEELMSSGDPALANHTDMSHLIDFDAGISYRDFYPPSGRVRALSAEPPTPMDLDAPAQTSDVMERFTVLHPSTPTKIEIPEFDDQATPGTAESGRSPALAPTSTPRKRRSSDASSTPMESPNSKRKRAPIP